MSEILEINGEQFLPAKTAGKRVGYTGDYVTRLLREGKVTGTKVGRQWFVNTRSFDGFVEAALAEKLEQRKKLSEVRKEEFQSRRKAESASPVSRGARPSWHSDEVRKHIIAAGSPLALAETFVILVIGIFVGIHGYFLNTGQLSYAFLNTASIDQVALTVYHFFSSTENAGTTTSVDSQIVGEERYWQPKINTTSLSWQEFHETARAKVEHEDFHTETSGAVLSADLSQKFSDEVDVVIEENGTMRTVKVTPHLKDSEEKGQHFFLVPIDESGAIDKEFEALIKEAVEVSLNKGNSG